ncbi:MAG: PilZ domain-containing protein [Algisphaera sp.]
MNTPALKLVTDTEIPDSYKFERRRAPRHSMNAHVTAVARHEDPANGCSGSICSIELVDSSATGLGGYSHQPLPLGARVAVFFPSHGPDAGYDAVGRVVRSVKDGDQWSIGLHLEQAQAAA